jgi:sugar phosphate isomerase/epimerase
VEILLENIPNGFSSAERLNWFLETTHLDLNYCFDVGHAHLGEGVERAFDIMKGRIRSTHVHDNDGKKDSHIFPLLGQGGTVDWNTAMRLLRRGADRFPLLLELKEAEEFPQPVAAAREIFEKLEAIRDEE